MNWKEAVILVLPDLLKMIGKNEFAIDHESSNFTLVMASVFGLHGVGIFEYNLNKGSGSSRCKNVMFTDV